MPEGTEGRRLVINTTPLLSLLAAMGNLDILKHLYSEVHVPLEVEREMLAGQGERAFGQAEFIADAFLVRENKPDRSLRCCASPWTWVKRL